MVMHHDLVEVFGHLVQLTARSERRRCLLGGHSCRQSFKLLNVHIQATSYDIATLAAIVLLSCHGTACSLIHADVRGIRRRFVFLTTPLLLTLTLLLLHRLLLDRL